ncbi:MAG: NfeD family protein [Desulfovibrionaceae bacterium]|nr:NfeD family protein [Desulfovibrionaceae bacterium]
MNAVIVWFVVGAALMVAELFTPGFVIVFFGVGAWAAALVAALHPGPEGELVAFLAVSVVSLFLLRRRLVNTFQGRRSEASQGAPEFAHRGRQAEVTQDIAAGGEGEIALGGSFWRATSPVAVARGTVVRVLDPVPGDELLIRVEPWTAEPAADSPL